MLTEDKSIEKAKAWFVHPDWSTHTAPLREWKTFSAIARNYGLTVDDLYQMAEHSERGVCIPLIPFFEREQIADMIAALDGPEAVAVFASQVARFDSLLTIEQEELPTFCWQQMNPQMRQALEFSAWEWMLDDDLNLQRSWPSTRGLDALQQRRTLQAEQGLMRLNQSVLNLSDPQYAPHEVAEVRDWFFRRAGLQIVTPAIEPIRATTYVTPTFYDQPPVTTTVQVPQMQPPDPAAPLMAVPHAPTLRQALNFLPLPQPVHLCLSLFNHCADIVRTIGEWKQLAASPEYSGPSNPLISMVCYLRSAEAPIDLNNDQRACAHETLNNILTSVPTLLRHTSVAGFPLPIMDLLACIGQRRNTDLRSVALNVLKLAVDQKVYAEDAAWWRAFRASITPKPRAMNLEFPEDRPQEVIREIGNYMSKKQESMQRRNLQTDSQAVFKAFKRGFLGEEVK